MEFGGYNTLDWEHARTRTIIRDGSRCTLSRLLGGTCHPTLHVHHLIPVEEGGPWYDDMNLITACASHHPVLEAMRREVMRHREPDIPRCTHHHPYPQGRIECERRLARKQRIAA